MAESLFSRKRDLVYFVYFCIAVPIGFIVDVQPVYPPSIVPAWMSGIKEFYINTYKDQFMINPPPFFELFLWSEILFQIPVMIWGIPALYRNSPKVPLVLLPFACLIFISTATCTVEFWFWDVPLSQKIDLSTLYGPYLSLSAFMLVDMYLRLNNIIDRSTALSSKAGQKKKQ